MCFHLGFHLHKWVYPDMAPFTKQAHKVLNRWGQLKRQAIQTAKLIKEYNTQDKADHKKTDYNRRNNTDYVHASDTRWKKEKKNLWGTPERLPQSI